MFKPILCAIVLFLFSSVGSSQDTRVVDSKQPVSDVFIEVDKDFVLAKIVLSAAKAGDAGIALDTFPKIVSFNTKDVICTIHKTELMAECKTVPKFAKDAVLPPGWTKVDIEFNYPTEGGAKKFAKTFVRPANLSTITYSTKGGKRTAKDTVTVPIKSDDDVRLKLKLVDSNNKAVAESDYVLLDKTKFLDIPLKASNANAIIKDDIYSLAVETVPTEITRKVESTNTFSWTATDFNQPPSLDDESIKRLNKIDLKDSEDITISTVPKDTPLTAKVNGKSINVINGAGVSVVKISDLNRLADIGNNELLLHAETVDGVADFKFSLYKDSRVFLKDSVSFDVREFPAAPAAGLPPGEYIVLNYKLTRPLDHEIQLKGSGLKVSSPVVGSCDRLNEMDCSYTAFVSLISADIISAFKVANVDEAKGGLEKKMLEFVVGDPQGKSLRSTFKMHFIRPSDTTADKIKQIIDGVKGGTRKQDDLRKDIAEVIYAGQQLYRAINDKSSSERSVVDGIITSAKGAPDNESKSKTAFRILGYVGTIAARFAGIPLTF
jgi:hypothetical protein